MKDRCQWLAYLSSVLLPSESDYAGRYKSGDRIYALTGPESCAAGCGCGCGRRKMAFSEMEPERNRGGILPDYLYKCGTTSSTSSSSLHSSASVLNLFKRNLGRSAAAAAAAPAAKFANPGPGFSSLPLMKPPRMSNELGKTINPISSKFMIPSATEPGGIELYSQKYFLTCATGGLICCGVTHCGMTPVDVVKCNMQIDPHKYKSIAGGFKTVVAEQGVSGLLRGWFPTLLGYSVQGAGKYGFYEFFKYYYGEQIGAEAAAKHKTLLFLAASASAEFLADIGLCPFEAVKVRIQTQPGYAKGLADGLPKMLAADGVGVLYRGLVPLWGRQIPYTMMKFSTFEATVEALYKSVVPVPKSELSKTGQLGVSFVAGYIAGIACAVISHPADNLVSYLNSKNGATVSMAFKDMGTTALLTRGLPLRIFMIGTLTAAQWGIYDSFKVFVGLPTTGGH